jgi:hypothetical protein
MVNDGERTSGNVGLRLTYAMIADRLGISGDAARMLVRRRGWQRIQPNRKGAPTVVVVTQDELTGELWRQERTFPDVRGTTPDIGADKGEQRANEGERALLAGALAALEDAVAALREQLVRAEQGRDGERQRADDLRAQIDVLNAELVVVRAEADRADALRERVDELQAGQQLMMDTHARALAEAQDQLERVRETAAEWRARGLVARLRAAWRGE